MTDSRRNADWLLDTAKAKADAVVELENVAWFGIDLLLEVDRIYRIYGPPPAPGDEVARLVAGIRHFLLKAPPLTPRPLTPDVVDSGELSATSGPDIDIRVDDDIARAIADLTEGDAA